MDGAIAQLGERLNGIQEVGGSTPPGSTTRTAVLFTEHPAKYPITALAPAT